MPEIVACPECGRKLKVPDEFLGKKVKCPQCSAMFQAEAEGGRGGGGGGGGGGGREEREERLSDRIGKRLGQEEERRRRDDDDDRPSRRGRDDDDDRGRSRRDRDDDDRPRSRRGRDDDDDYDDRPSRSRRGRDDDYDDDYDDDRGSGGGRNPSPKQEKAGWKAVSFGLLFIIISLWISIGAGLLSFAGNFILGALFRGGGSLNTLATLSYGLMIVVLLLNLAHVVVNLAGHGFTLATPPRRGWSTKPLGISSFSCLAAGTLCFVLGYLWMIVTLGLIAADPFGRVGAGAGVGAAAPLIGLLFLLGAGLYLAGSIVFMFYLNNVCLRIKRNDLAKNVIVCFIVIVGGTVVAMLISCLWFALIPSMVGSSRNVGEAVGSGYAMLYVGLVLFGLMALVGLAIYIWYIVLLYQVRGAVDTYVRRIGK